MRTRKPPPKLYVIASDTGQVYDTPVVARRKGTGITELYGPNWAALPLGTWRNLAMDRAVSAAEMRMLLFLLSKMRPGNHVDMRPIDVASELGQQPTNAAATLRRLVERGILIRRKPFGWRIDPNYVWRGDPTGMVGKRRDGSLVLLG